MSKANNDIRTKAIESNVNLWQIADELNIHYVTLNSKLRKELPEAEKKKIFDIINKLKS